MRIWMYCQHCSRMCEVIVRPSIDAIFGGRQVHRCENAHLLGVLQFTPEEIGVLP